MNCFIAVNDSFCILWVSIVVNYQYNFDIFFWFLCIFYIFINIHKYANEIICIHFHYIKNQCLTSISILFSFFYHQNWHSYSGFPEICYKTERLPWKRRLKKIAPLSDLSSYLTGLPFSCTSFWYQPIFSWLPVEKIFISVGTAPWL